LTSVTGMATPGINTPRQRTGASAGFSLLELLLTLVIVGLIISVAGVSVNSGRRSTEIDAALYGFADIAEYALQEAELNGIQMGLFMERELDGKEERYSYHWLQQLGSGWQTAQFDADAYGRRDLPSGIEVELEVEAIATELVAEAVEGEDVELKPQVVFYSSGEVTPGLMRWREASNGEILWELEWDLLGRLSFRRAGVADED
jgi:general secretion pathway protein H